MKSISNELMNATSMTIVLSVLPRLIVRYSCPNASPKVIGEETSKIEEILGRISQVK